jgi:hypothetical protein
MVKSKGVHSSPASSGSSGQGPRLFGWRSVEYTWPQQQHAPQYLSLRQLLVVCGCPATRQGCSWLAHSIVELCCVQATHNPDCRRLKLSAASSTVTAEYGTGNSCAEPGCHHTRSHEHS